jgi:hypothetical protein
MNKPVGSLRSRLVVVIIVFGMSVLGAIGIPSVAAQTGPGTVCVLQITADGAVLSILADQPEGFHTAVLVPESKSVNVPVTCESLETLALAVANQINRRVTVTTQVFNNRGELICFKGSFGVAKNGARGVVFSGCQ